MNLDKDKNHPEPQPGCRDIAGIAKMCSDCGTCLQACPVYAVELMETAAPRGRVNLIQAVMSGKLSFNRRNRRMIDQCLLCGGCEDACTRGVEFVDMMIRYRNHFSGKFGLPWLKKLILFLYQPRVMRKLLWGIRLLAHTPLKKLLLIPQITQPSRPVRRSESGSADILFFPGCVLENFYPHLLSHTVDFLEKQGFSVAVPQGLQCCGFPFLSQGWEKKFRQFRDVNKAVFSRFQYRYLVVPCATGVLAFKKFYQFSDADAARVMELSQFIFQNIPDAPLAADFMAGKGKITFHDPCHQLKSLKSREEPRHFLNRLAGRFIGRFIDDSSGLCCGFGGLFSVGFPKTSRAIFQRKAERLRELGVDMVVTTCPGCYLQLREHLPLDVKFFSELFSLNSEVEDFKNKTE